MRSNDEIPRQDRLIRRPLPADELKSKPKFSFDPNSIRNSKADTEPKSGGSII